MDGNMNFFGWIRNGVKQSVLLGFSDAIETIGAPDDPKNIHPNVVALLRGENSTAISQSSTARIPGTSAGSKKRLGKSLRDIEIPPGS